MVVLPETPASGSTPNLLLQMFNMIAAKRNAISPTRPRVAGTFILSCWSYRLRRMPAVPILQWRNLFQSTSVTCFMSV